MAQKIGLFVCKGNIHRSVIAEICFNRELKINRKSRRIVCISRGLQGTMGLAAPTGKNLRDYPMEWEASLPALKHFKIHISKNRKWIPVDEEAIEQASVILAMDREVLFGLSEDPTKCLTKMFPGHIDKMGLFTELAGAEENILDCGGKNDPGRHWNTIEQIDRISKRCFEVFIQLFDASDGLSVREKLDKLKTLDVSEGGNR